MLARFRPPSRKHLALHLLALLVVARLTYLLYLSQFGGSYPGAYGWPAYWLRTSRPSLETDYSHQSGSVIYSPLIAPRQVGSIDLDLLFISSHLLWGIALILVICSTWLVIAYWLPRVCRRMRFSLKSLLLVSTVVALATVLAQLRPSPETLKHAQEMRSQQPTFFAGWDPCGTWMPWKDRAMVTFGVFCAVLVVGNSLLTCIGNQVAWSVPSAEKAPTSEQAPTPTEGGMPSEAADVGMKGHSYMPTLARGHATLRDSLL